MPLLRKIKNILCCTSNKYLLDDDDDDDTASILEHSSNQGENSNNNQPEISEKPLLSEFDNTIDTTNRPYQPVIVKSVLRKRNASVSNPTKGNVPRRRYNVLLFGDSLTAGWVKNADGYGTYHPYGLRVQKRFEDEGLDVEV
ncbi:hypothetical protein Glove_296g43 [Diversispora epigaea]|uniref:Uncharacterized protein n=1 Tax=Diversispora epigaea TaxID=1348612 RepID=A0A397I333_9GLOM|nr:hypothetical protein Glove_296g43 [Diversispora epigaea]